MTMFLTDDHKISRAEFDILLMVSKDVKETNYLNHFRAADTNHDGYVSEQELKNRMTQLGKSKGKIPSLSTVRDIIQKSDQNGDGKLGYYGK